MTNARPTKPQRIRTADGHVQTYYVATGPEPREAVATLTKPDPQPLAPAAATTTTSETGLVTIRSEAGTFTYLNDLPHSENDQPSHRRADGSLAWYRHGEPHRFGGPSATDPDGSESWYAFGERHRDGGPAVTHRNGSVEFHVLGVRYESVKAADKATAEQIESQRVLRDIEGKAMKGWTAEVMAASVAARDESIVSPYVKSDSVEVRTGMARSYTVTNAAERSFEHGVTDDITYLDGGGAILHIKDHGTGLSSDSFIDTSSDETIRADTWAVVNRLMDRVARANARAAKS